MYSDFAKWLDNVLAREIPSEVEAFCFNLYEEEDMGWSMQLVGCPDFAQDDADWACDEVFSTGENLFSWRQEADWETVLEDACVLVGRYLQNGGYAQVLMERRAVAIGFVDGDLSILYVQQ